MYVLIKNNTVSKYPYSLDQLKQDNPNTSFPSGIPETLSEQFGCFKVAWVSEPVVGYTENVSADHPVLTDGEWVQTWKIETASTEEKASRLSAAWSALRNERNSRLSECDWTQLSDSSVDKVAWAAYRQELRDLPFNTSDPFNPVWPIKP